uniref:Uncharacterized protein n=1 Tax=Candidatus Desulfatibia profunda TaxID=2841695 RepID=A0A8J6NTM0_9BACT|nr:hypothetical protein [Candidatus Desulfatibia profunda]
MKEKHDITYEKVGSNDVKVTYSTNGKKSVFIARVVKTGSYGKDGSNCKMDTKTKDK